MLHLVSCQVVPYGAAGGKQQIPVREYYPGEKPYRMVYIEDPFDNIVEIYSHSYELTYSAGAYQV